MPRGRRVLVEGGLYHVYNRFARGAELLNKHPVAVSRWVSDAARRRQEDRAFEEELDNVDQALSVWALDALKRGELTPNLDENLE